MKLHLPLLMLLSMLSLSLFSQKYTLSGYIEDNESGEKMIAANIYIDSTYIGTTSNQYGFYSITLDKGTYPMVFSYAGYTPVKKMIVLDKDIALDIRMIPNTTLKAVEITAQAEKVEMNTQMSVIKVPMRDIKNLPAIMGETYVNQLICS
jgi:hypothetical protein